MELVRQKNAATIISFPLIDSNGDPVTGQGASADSELDVWDDGTSPDGFTDCTNEATEIGTTGVYYLSLTQTEMNNDYIVIRIASSGAKTQHILIRTIVGDPLNVATTDDTLNADMVSISGDSTAADNLESDYDGTGYTKTNSTVGTVTTVGTCTTNTDMRGTDNALLAASAPTNFSDLAVTASTGQVTVGTNNDKTGYALSGTAIDDIIDEIVEGTTTVRQALRLFLAVLTGTSSGGGSTTQIYKSLDGGTNRITATVDSNGNRSAVTRDAT